MAGSLILVLAKQNIVTISSKSPFTRDRFTWLAYLLLAYYTFLEAALGPLMPFLRAEFALNYTSGGLHFSAFALGMILAGISGDSLTRRRGRTVVFWGGAAGMAIGALGLVLAGQVALTIAASFVMGFLGTLLLVVIQAALSDHHGPNRVIALTESNVGASLSVAMVPLLIGTLERAGLSWRLALVLAVAFLVLVFVRFRTVAIPAGRSGEAQSVAKGDPLPRAFWAYWLVVVLGVSIEWCLVFWGADYLVSATGLDKTDAVTAMTLFFLAMVLGRFTASRLSRRVEGASLLIATWLLTLAGFAILYISNPAWLTLVGLFIAGFGVANFYPLTLAIATSVAPQQADKASARMILGIGLAIFFAPLLLGWSADRWGIENAFAIVGLLLLATIGVITAARRI